MSQNLFSLSIFFVVFREALETALIISVLLSLVDQIIHESPPPSFPDHTNTDTPLPAHTGPLDPESARIAPRILRKLRLQVWSHL